ncbi:MAG: hypothetical protein ABSC56_09800 [Solirubrobacteraceae bacterium]|jgi:hypothetical protein
MASPQLVQEDRGAGIGAAAAYAAAARRRELLSDAKVAWLDAFAEFKDQEARRSDPLRAARDARA